MSAESITPEFVVSCITDAWREEVYSAWLESELTRDCGSPEAFDACRLFVGKKWQDVDDAILLETCPSPFLIGNTPIRYYLGAFLICAVRTSNDPTCNLMDNLVEFQLKLPRKPTAVDYFRARFDPLTIIQKLAVACFLQYCLAYYSTFSVRAARRIQYSLDNYWSIA